MISSENGLVCACVDANHAEHTVESPKPFHTILCQDRCGYSTVSVVSSAVTVDTVLRRKSAIVVNLTVEHKRDIPIFGDEGLRATGVRRDSQAICAE